MLWLIPCQLCSGHIYRMPVMLYALAIYYIHPMPAMLWLMPCQLCSSYCLYLTCQLGCGYIHPMPAMLSGLSHASYVLAIICTRHATCQLCSGYIHHMHMPAMLWLIPCQLCSGYIHPLPAKPWLIPCQLCSGYSFYLTCHMPGHASYALAIYIHHMPAMLCHE